MYLFTDMYLFGDPLNRQTFRGSFVVSSWGNQEASLEVRDNSTREQELREAIFKSYRTSELRSCFVAAELLALDK